MDRKNDGLRLMDGAGYKKIIIACDSYKGCLSSREVNEAIASGVKEWNAEAASPEIITLEMSDGGEGMLDAFLSAMKGERVKIHAHDALMRWIEAEYGIVNDTAIIEIAQMPLICLICSRHRHAVTKFPHSFRKESKPQIKPENLTTWKMMPESSMIPKMT